MEIVRLQECGIGAAVQKATAVLSSGGIVLYPTDTLYGLAADATNPAALATLRALKGRETKKPIFVVIPDIGSIGTYAVLNEAGKELARRFLPGPLTLVAQATDALPKELTLAGGIGIRIPDDAFCSALAQAFGKPFTATSANRSGQETRATVHDIICQFGHLAEEIALAIDDGDRKGGRGSTVVTVMSGTPHILREGAIPGEALSL